MKKEAVSTAFDVNLCMQSLLLILYESNKVCFDECGYLMEIKQLKANVTGQVLKHEDLDNFLSSRVPSLTKFQSRMINGQLKTSTVRLLANVMLFLQR